MTWCHVLGPTLRLRCSPFLTAAITAQLILLSCGAFVVSATPFDYPFPYLGPFTTTTPASWGLGETPTIPFTLPAADIRNGELLSTTVKVDIPYSPITSFFGTLSASGRASVVDTWDLKIPGLTWDRPFVSGPVFVNGPANTPFNAPGFIFDVSGRPGGALLTFSDTGPPPGFSPALIPHFDRNNPLAYTLDSVPIGGPSPITGNFTVSSAVTAGSVLGYHYDNPITIGVTQQFRQWNAEDLVAGRLTVTDRLKDKSTGLPLWWPAGVAWTRWSGAPC